MQTLKMAAVAACLLAGLYSPARAASTDSANTGSGGIIPALPAGTKLSVRFLTDRVAAGAIATKPHQAEFEVLALDAKGKPRGGVSVALPVIASGGRGKKKGTVTATMAWSANTVRLENTLGVTGPDGIARGLFTSGNWLEDTVIQIPGTTATAEIKQVWNDDSEEIEDENGDAADNRARYRMRYQRTLTGPDGKAAEVWEPISGHSMYLELDLVRIEQYNPNSGPDEDEDGQPDGETEERTISSKDADPTEWKRLQQYVSISPVHEVEPGIYQGSIIITPPKDEAGQDVFTVSHSEYSIWDKNCCENGYDDD